MRKAAAQDREYKRSDKSRAPPERFGKSYPHAVPSKLTKITVPETSEKNGVAERFHRAVVEAARCLPMDSKLPKS